MICSRLESKRYVDDSSVQARENKRIKLNPIWLPSDIWKEIIMHSLTPKSDSLKNIISKYSVVNRAWLDFCTIAKIELLNQGVGASRLFNSITRPSISGSGFEPDVMRVFSNRSRSIKKLNLDDCSVNTVRVQHLSNLYQLKEISFDSVCFADDVLGCVSHLTLLTSFSVSQSSITHNGISCISNLLNLNSLTIDFCKNIKDDGACFSALRSLTNLTCLVVVNQGYDYFDTSFLLELKQLRYLNLWDSCIDRSYLSGLTALTSLTLGGYLGMLETTEEVHCLTGLTNLEELMIAITSITSEGVRLLSRLPKLASLDMTDCPNVDDDMMEALSLCTSLTNIAMSPGEDVTDRGALHLFKLPYLRCLEWDADSSELGKQLIARLEALEDSEGNKDEISALIED